MSLYKERLDRMLAAVALEPVDRAPFSYLGNAVNAQFTGASMPRYCSDMEYCCTTNLKGIEMIGDIDSAQALIFMPALLAPLWLSKVEVAGVELPDDALWQVNEMELVTLADYDEILSGGFAPWFAKFLKEKLGDPMEKAASFVGYMGEAIKRFAEAGIPSFNGGNFCSPFEMFCGGRSFTTFLCEDLIERPDMIDKVFEAAHEFNLASYKAQMTNPAGKPNAVWVGSWRGTPGILSPEMFERFSWKYIKDIVELVLSCGVVPILHLDSCWDNGFKYFKELPKRKCVLSFDSQTDIFAAKESIGDDMCIMGDVPAQLLAFGTPDEVTSYCKKLISEVGPTGFILSSGCDVPHNAKLENVQAMAASVKL